MMDSGSSVCLYAGSVSAEFTSGNCAKTLKKLALHSQPALCEAEASLSGLWISPPPPCCRRASAGEQSDSKLYMRSALHPEPDII